MKIPESLPPALSQGHKVMLKIAVNSMVVSSLRILNVLPFSNLSTTYDMNTVTFRVFYFPLKCYICYGTPTLI